MNSKVKIKHEKDDKCEEIKNKIEFTSEIFLGDPLEASSSNCKEKQDDHTLVSSFKQKRLKERKHTVKWADQEEAKSTSILSNELKEDDESSVRIANAEACATALLEASEAISSGEFEDENAGTSNFLSICQSSWTHELEYNNRFMMIMFAAVSQAGLVILPNPYNHGKSESITNVEELQFSKNTMKWPTKSVLSNDDVFDIKDSWYDTMPPEDFTLTVSFKFRMKSGNF